MIPSKNKEMKIIFFTKDAGKNDVIQNHITHFSGILLGLDFQPPSYRVLSLVCVATKRLGDPNMS